MTARILRFPTAVCIDCGALYDYRTDHIDVCKAAAARRAHPSNRCRRPDTDSDGAA